MLLLTRKSKDQIRIGDNVTTTILRIQGKSVRIGVDAPYHVRIVRSELPCHHYSWTEPQSHPSTLASRIDLPTDARNDSSRSTINSTQAT